MYAVGVELELTPVPLDGYDVMQMVPLSLAHRLECDLTSTYSVFLPDDCGKMHECFWNAVSMEHGVLILGTITSESMREHEVFRLECRWVDKRGVWPATLLVVEKTKKVRLP